MIMTIMIIIVINPQPLGTDTRKSIPNKLIDTK